MLVPGDPLRIYLVWSVGALSDTTIPHGAWGMAPDRIGKVNLLTDPILTLAGGEQVSLPGLFAALATGKARGFPALRAHQRPAWHMFLVQLAALALWHQQRATRPPSEVPADPACWAAALRTLTADHADDAPWRLVVDDDTQPAFLQPPAPRGLKWSTVHTPDELDLLITSRNHDLKRMVAHRAAAEDWVFALVSLQTSEGYGGKGNQGIARMNGGSSSRPLLGLAPAAGKETAIDPAAWWMRDVLRVLELRDADHGRTIGTPGGPALLWCLEWQEGQQLDLRTLDPWFIEVCRRIRLYLGDAIIARRSTSKATRIDAKQFKGVVGDPWTPVHRTEEKSLTLSGGDFDYRRLCALLFSGDWEVPPLAREDASGAEQMLLVAEALARGNAKTEGFKSRVLPIPGRIARRMFSSPTAAYLSKAQMQEIEAFDKALRTSLALLAARGDRELLNRDHYAFSKPARARFNQEVDRLFFSSLWRRVEAAADPAAAEKEKTNFLAKLHQAAQAEFDAALPTIPCTAIHRPRAEARARRRFRSAVWRSYPELFDVEGNDEIA